MKINNINIAGELKYVCIFLKIVPISDRLSEKCGKRQTADMTLILGVFIAQAHTRPTTGSRRKKFLIRLLSK